jgi:hypothetical protein
MKTAVSAAEIEGLLENLKSEIDKRVPALPIAQSLCQLSSKLLENSQFRERARQLTDEVSRRLIAECEAEMGLQGERGGLAPVDRLQAQMHKEELVRWNIGAPDSRDRFAQTCTYESGARTVSECSSQRAYRQIV